MQLSDIIRQRIETGGPISFRDYMEMCLYYPDLGYYTSSKEKIGAGGDYYTSSSLGNAFGTLIARRIRQMWDATGEPDFTIIEMGAGAGWLARDILDYFKNENSLPGKLSYIIIEKSASMRKRAKAILSDEVEWYDTLNDIQGITGCIFSNELLDNFPVHVVVMENNLLEVYVGYDGGFIEILQPADISLIAYLDELDIKLPFGFRTEVSLDTLSWLKSVSETLEKGFLMTIDYGGLTEDLYKEFRREGTLVCYYRHQVSTDPYIRAGEQDITSHINFSLLMHWGKKLGLEVVSYKTQSDFLLEMGYLHLTNKEAKVDTKANIAFIEVMRTRKLLMEIGYRHKVLVQSKGI